MQNEEVIVLVTLIIMDMQNNILNIKLFSKIYLIYICFLL